MKGIKEFTLTEIKLVLKDKTFYLWAMLLPLFFVFIFSGDGSGSGDDQTSRIKPGLMVTDLSKSEMSSDLVNFLKTEDLYFYPEDAKDIKRELIIPQDFSKKIKDKQPVTLQLKLNTDDPNEAEISAKISIYRAVFKFLAKKEFNISQPREFFTIESTWLGHEKKASVPVGYLHQIPATIINFLMFNLLIYGGITVVKLRERGMLRRLVTTPQGKAGIWLSLLITNIFLGIIVIIMVFLSSSLVFDVSFFNLASFPVFLVLLVYTISLAALGIFIGSMFKKHESIIGVSVLIANLFAALGGCWWPIEVVPDFMKRLALLVPAGWAVNGIDKLLFFKEPLSSVYPNLFFLLLFAVFFSFLSIKFFKVENH